MRTITLPNGKTYEVGYAWGPTRSGTFELSMKDERRLPEIAAEFDGIDEINFHDDDVGDLVFRNFTRLTNIRERNNEILISLSEE